MSRSLANAISNQNAKEERYVDLAYSNSTPSRFENEQLSARSFGDSLDPAKQKGRSEALQRAKTWRTLADNFRPVGDDGSSSMTTEEVA